MATQAEIEAAVSEDALSGIKEAENDMGRVEMMPLKERLEAATALATSASGASPWANVCRARLIPPGAQ